MCDTVIDEHFRRSLGNNYMELFDKSSNGGSAVVKAPISSTPTIGGVVGPAPTPMALKTKRVVKTTPPPPPVVAEVKKPPEVQEEKEDDEDMADAEDANVNFSVDDHFAKALGETWNKLKANNHRQEVRGTTSSESNEESETDDEDSDEHRNSSRHKKRPRTDRRGV